MEEALCSGRACLPIRPPHTIRKGRFTVTWAFALTAAFAGLLGFGAGLLTFKRTSRWCPDCGKTLSCGQCGSEEGVARPPAVIGLNRGAAVR